MRNAKLLTVLASTVASAITVFADTWIIDGVEWSYSIADGKATITKASPATGSLAIPDKIGDEAYPVASIGDEAFSGCESLTDVTIGNSVTNIGDYAFQECVSLTRVAIPDSVTCIGVGAFSYCAGLTNVTIPSTITRIEEDMFLWCESLSNVTIPDSVTYIGDYVFYGCSGLTSMTIPDSVTDIGWSAFDNCSNLAKLSLPAHLLGLIECEGCSSELEVEYRLDHPIRILSYNDNDDGSITITGFEIGWGANELRIPSEIDDKPVTRINDYAFEGESFTTVAIPDSVTSIGNGAFCGNSFLTSVTIGNSVTNIGDCAFQECENLTSIMIPDSVTNIGDYAFAGCVGLTNITIGNGVANIGDYAFAGCVGLTNITIGNGVANIGYCAFQSCESLINVTIPDSVKRIRDDAFDDCCSLVSVTMRGDCPVGSVYMFWGANPSCIVYLPRGNTTYPVSDGKWLGLAVEYYGAGAASGTVAEAGDGIYTFTANEGETLKEEDISFSAVVNGAVVDTTKGYEIKIADDGKSATVALKTPAFGAAAVAGVGDIPDTGEDESDPTGALVDAAAVSLADAPVPDESKGEEVGALPVAAVPGLYYQAAWGSDLGRLASGKKVQATGDTLYLGVIKQSGDCGFYKLTVSEK